MRNKESRSGQSMVEFIIVMPVLLLFIFGTLQYGFIYWAQATLDLAAFQTAREGSVRQADLAVMDAELVKGITPLFTRSADSVGIVAGHKVAQKVFDAKRICLEVLNPTPTAVAFFGAGNPMPNDNLMLRDPTDGAAIAGMSIQDANILKIKVTYCFRLIVPMVSQIISNIAGACPLAGAVADGEPRITLYSYATVRMQSSVVDIDRSCT